MLQRIGMTQIAPSGEDLPAELASPKAAKQSPRLSGADFDEDAVEDAVGAGQASAPVSQTQSGLLVFERKAEDEHLLCIFNLAGSLATHSVGAGKASVLWTGDAVLAGGNLALEPYGSAILKLA